MLELSDFHSSLWLHPLLILAPPHTHSFPDSDYFDWATHFLLFFLLPGCLSHFLPFSFILALLAWVLTYPPQLWFIGGNFLSCSVSKISLFHFHFWMMLWCLRIFFPPKKTVSVLLIPSRVSLHCFLAFTAVIGNVILVHLHLCPIGNLSLRLFLSWCSCYTWFSEVLLYKVLRLKWIFSASL